MFTTQLLLDNEELFDNSLKNHAGYLVPIHYCYGSWQKGLEKPKKGGVKFHEGIPESESLSQLFPEGVFWFWTT